MRRAGREARRTEIAEGYGGMSEQRTRSVAARRSRAAPKPL
jgi:hypothetical protein